eukprot:590644-Amphidinium_carterae.2
MAEVGFCSLAWVCVPKLRLDFRACFEGLTQLVSMGGSSLWCVSEGSQTLDSQRVTLGVYRCQLRISSSVVSLWCREGLRSCSGSADLDHAELSNSGLSLVGLYTAPLLTSWSVSCTPLHAVLWPSGDFFIALALHWWLLSLPELLSHWLSCVNVAWVHLWFELERSLRWGLLV